MTPPSCLVRFLDRSRPRRHPFPLIQGKFCVFKSLQICSSSFLLLKHGYYKCFGAFFIFLFIFQLLQCESTKAFHEHDYYSFVLLFYLLRHCSCNQSCHQVHRFLSISSHIMRGPTEKKWAKTILLKKHNDPNHLVFLCPSIISFSRLLSFFFFGSESRNSNTSHYILSFFLLLLK